MFNKDELNTIAILLKSGIKTMDLTGNNLIIVGALMRKIEDQLAKEMNPTASEVPAPGNKPVPPVEKKEEIPSKKQKNP